VTLTAILNVVATASERRCQATNKRGERCRANVVNAAGYCAAHDPANPMDMRALGKLSGERRRQPSPERVPESFREWVRREGPPPERIWQALETAMEAQSESARVSASKVLMDALAEPSDSSGGCRICAQRKAEMPAVRAKLDRLIAARAATAIEARAQLIEDELGAVRAALEEHDPSLLAALETAQLRIHERIEEANDGDAGALRPVIDSVADEYANSGRIPADVTPEQVTEILRGLEEIGLISPGPRWRAKAFAADRESALADEQQP
jgi:hypothetical protein